MRTMHEAGRFEPGQQAGRVLRGLLSGSVLAGTIAVGGGVGVAELTSAAPAGAAAANTCPVTAPATTAQASSTTGISAKTVTVGNVSIITGPVPGLFEGAPTGVKAYFAYINSKGGVNGRKLELNSKDDAFSGSQNATETAEAVSNDFAMVGSFSLFDGYGCKSLAADPAIPDVSVTLDPNAEALPNDFSAEPTVLGASLGPFQYYKKHYPKDTTIGAIVSDVSSAEDQFAGEEAAAKSLGYKIGYVDDVNPLESNFTTDVINMRNKGVNAVDLTALDWQDAAIFVQNAAAQGWKPGLIFSAGPVYADQFISHAGGPAATDGIMLGQGQALYLGQDQNSVPADKLFIKYVKQVNSSWTPDLYTLFGWASAELFVQALQAAGKNPTRGEVIDQLKKITKFDASGLLSDANPAAKKPSGCYLMATVKNGQYVRVQPKSSGFTCDTTYFDAPASDAASS
jgi:ABC-type branched-subunit amino acid transport system substrate-binding protein